MIVVGLDCFLNYWWFLFMFTLLMLCLGVLCVTVVFGGLVGGLLVRLYVDLIDSVL